MVFSSRRRSSAALLLISSPRCRLFLVVGLFFAQGTQRAFADDAPAAGSTPAAEETWAIHGQSTVTEQYHPAFTSPFRGPESLDPGSRGDETLDVTLFVGIRLWSGAEFWLNPEMDQGFGLSNTLGVAGFTSAEAYKVGEADPYYKMQRGFLRQTIDLGGDTQTVDADQNQLAGTTTANRVVLTVGKYSVVDIFDTNRYAHDPRSDFLNWSVVDSGAFDYAADAWGYTYGATAEWYQDWWTIRTGLFDGSSIPNSTKLDTRFISQFQAVTELEERHSIGSQPGKLKFLAWLTRARLGLYSEATDIAVATGLPADIAAVRDYRSKWGFGLNLEQQLAEDIGLFARAGITESDVEAYDFTDISQSLSAGLSFGGNRWGRSDDAVGVAFALNNLSRQGQRFLNAGGLGILVGDGILPHPGLETIFETYYSLAAFTYAHVTADYQFIANPAYNTDRGPVSVLGIRLHAQF
jgi:high affinity Mn2+ porin